MRLSKTAKFLMRGKGGLSRLSKIEADLPVVEMFGEGFADGDISPPMSVSLGGERFRCIGSGADRVVYLGKSGLILKFPSNTEWSEKGANGVEFKVFNHITRTPLSRYFAPVVALLEGYGGGEVLVTHYVVGGDDIDYDENDVANDRLHELLYAKLPVNICPADLHYENHVGMKIIDYGRFFFN